MIGAAAFVSGIGAASLPPVGGVTDVEPTADVCEAEAVAFDDGVVESTEAAGDEFGDAFGVEDVPGMLAFVIVKFWFCPVC